MHITSLTTPVVSFDLVNNTGTGPPRDQPTTCLERVPAACLTVAKSLRTRYQTRPCMVHAVLVSRNNTCLQHTESNTHGRMRTQPSDKKHISWLGHTMRKNTTVLCSNARATVTESPATKPPATC